MTIKNFKKICFVERKKFTLFSQFYYFVTIIVTARIKYSVTETGCKTNDNEKVKLSKLKKKFNLRLMTNVGTLYIKLIFIWDELICKDFHNVEETYQCPRFTTSPSQKEPIENYQE